MTLKSLGEFIEADHWPHPQADHWPHPQVAGSAALVPRFLAIPRVAAAAAIPATILSELPILALFGPLDSEQKKDIPLKR